MNPFNEDPLINPKEQLTQVMKSLWGISLAISTILVLLPISAVGWLQDKWIEREKRGQG